MMNPIANSPDMYYPTPTRGVATCSIKSGRFWRHECRRYRLFTANGCDGCRRFVMNENAAIEVAAFQQFVVRPLIHQFAFAQHQYLVGPADLREAMGNQQRGTPL